MGRKASNLRVPCEQAVAIVGRKTSLLTGRHQAQGGTAIYTDLSVISCVFCIFKLNNKDIYLWWKLGNYWKNNKMGKQNICSQRSSVSMFISSCWEIVPSYTQILLVQALFFKCFCHTLWPLDKGLSHFSSNWIQKPSQMTNSSFIVLVVKQGRVFSEEVISSRRRFLGRSSAREEWICYSRSWPWWVWRNNAEFATWFKGLTCLFGWRLHRSY